MIVCICHRISDKTLAQHARSGMAFEDMQAELGVGTQCGRCEGCARSIWSECSPHAAMAHVRQEASPTAAFSGALRGSG